MATGEAAEAVEEGTFAGLVAHLAVAVLLQLGDVVDDGLPLRQQFDQAAVSSICSRASSSGSGPFPS